MSYELSFETSRDLSPTHPGNVSFYFSARNNISFNFYSSATTDLYVVEGGALLSKPTIATEIRIRAVSFSFTPKIQIKWSPCLLGLVSVGEQCPQTWDGISVPGLGSEPLRSCLLTSCNHFPRLTTGLCLPCDSEPCAGRRCASAHFHWICKKAPLFASLSLSLSLSLSRRAPPSF